MAGLLVLAGGAAMARGVGYGIQHGAGWRGVVVPAVVGALTIGLGLARWRFWRRG
jgi:hypothetical protein